MADTEVDVFVQMGGVDVLAGRLWSHRRRSTESATFAYDSGYIANRDAYELDPALPLVEGQQQTPDERKIFGAFSDCAPDRWGRRLIARAEQQSARRESRAARSFGEMDYLLGVRDDMRQGALRFRNRQDGRYLADEDHGVPPLVDLPALLSAADRLERDDAGEADLQLLLRGGSSLGGARPKAHVMDGNGRLAIAKFPSSLDEWDVIRWEAVALELARQAGIRVPDSQVVVADGKAVLIVDRFDRTADWRIGYASAMTMLEAQDGDHGSYLDIASVIEETSPQAKEDLRELWTRIVFSILVSNTDDHLRNHGFLRVSTSGWSLSPAFDINPDPRPGPKRLNTSIDEADDTASIELALEVAGYFRLSGTEALSIVADVARATNAWRRVASELQLSNAAIDAMADAFDVARTSVS